jgi:RNA polymerase sigma factor (TIGR02999 family)
MPSDITELLVALREGRRDAQDQLLPLVYDELRSLAARRLGRAGADRTLGPTALLHETYLRLFDQTRVELNDRRHFFAVAAIAMRQILVDHARRRLALKRGGDQVRVPLDDRDHATDERLEEILSLDEALVRLKEMDERLARVVELRYFAGLTVDETADVLGVTGRTIKRDWRKARAVLYDMLHGPEDPE